MYNTSQRGSKYLLYWKNVNHKYRRDHLTIATLFKQVYINNHIPIYTSSVHSKYYYFEYNLQPVNYNVNKPQLDPTIRGGEGGNTPRIMENFRFVSVKLEIFLAFF
jgi:hypothetical protein